jgi:hypothetical protein
MRHAASERVTRTEAGLLEERLVVTETPFVGLRACLKKTRLADRRGELYPQQYGGVKDPRSISDIIENEIIKGAT